MDKISFKFLWPYLAAILFFILMSAIYFSPALDGKKLMQSDIAKWRGMSKEIIDYREKTGEEPLWTNSMFGGMPAYQISAVFKGNFFVHIDKFLKLGLPHPLNILFLYFLGFFILLLALRMNIWLAILGAIGFAFSSYFFIIIEAGHNSKAHAISYMAPVIAGILLTYRGKYLWGAAIFAIFLALQLRTNHLQITYYLMIIILIFGITQLMETIQKKNYQKFFKATALLVIAAIFAVAANISNIWATYEYGKYTIRGASELTSERENRTTGLDIDYATQWSYGIPETFTLLIPDFMGGASGKSPKEASNTFSELQRTVGPQAAREYLSYFSLYWGKQPFTSGPVYAGAIMVFLFVLGLIVIKGKYKWWLLSATVISIMLAWGKNFMPLTEFFLHYVPGYNKFRAVSMTLVIADLTIPLLGMLALKEIFTEGIARNKSLRSLALAFSITGGLILLLIATAGALFDFSAPSDRQLLQAGFPQSLINAVMADRLALLRSEAFRSLIFIALAALALWLAISQKMKKEYVFIILIALVIFDMWPVNKRYLNEENFENARRVENPWPATAADQQILQDKDPNFRVLNQAVNTFNDASTSYYHKSIGGYHGAKLRRYQELIDFHISQNNMNVLNMLNTKYIIYPDQNRQPRAQINPGALGNAWAVRNFRMVKNADEEINALNDFNPRSEAIVDKRFEKYLENFNPNPDPNVAIELISYAPNKLVYSFKSTSDELVVFSEIYYDKGWNVYIDGEKLPYFRANYVLRSMVVPAGNHEIVWKFEPAVYHTGSYISAIASILILLTFFAGVGAELKVKLR
jgi:hypothetical protein